MIFGEARVAEDRAARLDLAARAKFAEDGERIFESRTLIAGRTEPDLINTTAIDTARSLEGAGAAGLVEV